MDRSCQRPRDQLFCSVRWRMQCMATSTRNNSSVSLNSLAVSIPGFFLFGRFAASWARALSAMDLFVLRAQIRSFCEYPSQPNVPGSWDPNSVFFHSSNSKLFSLFLATSLIRNLHSLYMYRVTEWEYSCCLAACVHKLKDCPTPEIKWMRSFKK